MSDPINYTVRLSRAIDAKYAAYRPGDADSEWRLYDALQAQAANVVYHCLEVSDKDLVSTIVHRAMLALSGFRNKSKISTWFYRLAQNEAKRALRARITSRKRFVPLTISDEDGEERPWPIKANRDNHDEQIDLDRIRRRLPPKQAEIVSLLTEGYSLEEIARKTGVPIGTVRSRYRLAKSNALRPPRPKSPRRK